MDGRCVDWVGGWVFGRMNGGCVDWVCGWVFGRLYGRYRLAGLVVKASASRAPADRGFEPLLHRDFFRGRLMPVTHTMWSTLGLVSVYCDWVR